MNNLLSKDVVRDWGLQTLSEKKQAEMVERIGRILYQAILVRSLDILSDKEQEELDRLLDKDNTTPDMVLAFLRSKIPTFEMLLREEKNNLKAEIVLTV